jgi:hypothetical protein
MKTKLIAIAFLMSMLLINNVEAQFLKKLKKKVEDEVERTVINKTADKAADKASKSMDKVFDPNLSGKKGKKVTPTNLPDSFDFDYKYQLKITTSKDEMNMDYRLKKGASYLGVAMDVGPKMFMVMDGAENITYMFIESGDSKICTATSLDVSDEVDDEINNLENYTLTSLPNKTFLGFDCEGVQMEDDDYVFIMYYTSEAEVSFNDVFKSDPDRIPPALKSHFENNQKALMMYMDMKDKKNKGKKNTSGTMECTLLEATSFKLNTAGYKLM